MRKPKYLFSFSFLSGTDVPFQRGREREGKDVRTQGRFGRERKWKDGQKGGRTEEVQMIHAYTSWHAHKHTHKVLWVIAAT